MTYLTWGEIKRQIQNKHGIEGDKDYPEQELIDIANKAINKVEAHIIKLQQDYFLTVHSINVLGGQLEYDLPNDIYAYKIRRVFLPKGQPVYRAVNLNDMMDESKFRYQILNHSDGQRKLTLNKSIGDTTLKIYYTRNANKLTLLGGDGQIVDIMEYADAVMDRMSYMIEFKDKSPTVQLALNDYNESISDLTNSLAMSVNDENTEMEANTEFMDDHI